MSYALLKRGMIVGKINQGSDHLQLYDISSLLKSHKVPGYENAKDGVMWDVDCIAKNGLLRFYSINGGPTFQLEA